MRKILFIGFVFLLAITFGFAHSGEDDFKEAESLIASKIPCEDLTDSQLEMLGDYYMEQMHPGEQHEIMDEMMGGEDSLSLEQAHIRLALSFYCGQHDVLSYGMMQNIMGRGAMMTTNSKQLGGGFNMMSGYGVGAGGFFGMTVLWILYVAIAAFIFGIVFWGTKRLLEQTKKKK